MDAGQTDTLTLMVYRPFYIELGTVVRIRMIVGIAPCVGILYIVNP